MRYTTIIMSVALVAAMPLHAAVTPAAWLTSGMVIQRGQEVTLRGTADAGEVFEVAFDGASPITKAGQRLRKQSVTAGDDGKWTVTLPALKEGGPFVMELGDVRLTDVMVGDVYLCSGQSNMELPVRRVMDKYAMEINGTVDRNVRMLKVRPTASFSGPATEVETDGWKSLDPETSADFSACAYFFAREMRAAKPGMAVGVVEAAVGGSPIEAWMSREQLLADGFVLPVNQLDVAADDAYRKAVDDYGKAAGDRWESVLAAKEAALGQDWTAESFDDSKWESVMATSDSWGHDSVRALNGAHWFRKTIEVSGSQASLQATLRLGTLVDADEVWVNGVKVGVTYYQYPPRIYDIPQGVLHAGKNVIAVRLVSQNGAPAFVADKYRGIFFGGNRWLEGMNVSKIDLDDEWRHTYAVPMPAKPGVPFFFYTPTVLYNAMVAPLDGMRFAGALWYQGESNVGREGEYRTLINGMMANWRSLFANPKMKFVIIELADFEKPVKPWLRRFQDMQAEVAAADPYAALAPARDLGEWNDIHPLNKKTVGVRAANAMKSIKTK